MCMSVSGRCVISDYLTGRSANKGACSQPCRWNYRLEEEKRPGQYFPVEEDQHGTYLFNSKDMNMLSHLDEIREAGVNSIKIEGRNKKSFYVASVVNAYRQVLDGADPEIFQEELLKNSHRPYSTGFYFGMAQQETEMGGQIQDTIHVATAEGSILNDDGTYHAQVRCHNRIRVGDEIEVLSPHQPVRSMKVGKISWLNPGGHAEEVEAANRSLDTYFFDAPFEIKKHDLIRIDQDKYRADVNQD